MTTDTVDRVHRKASSVERVRPGWHEYEARKQAWSDQHPEATPAEYEQAMRRIAEECGL